MSGNELRTLPPLQKELLRMLDVKIIKLNRELDHAIELRQELLQTLTGGGFSMIDEVTGLGQVGSSLEGGNSTGKNSL
jgi:hypothetical protein